MWSDVVDRTRHGVDAFFGVAFLSIGVVAQIVGSLAEVGGERSSPFGGDELRVGLLLLVPRGGGAIARRCCSRANQALRLWDLSFGQPRRR